MTYDVLFGGAPAYQDLDQDRSRRSATSGSCHRRRSASSSRRRGCPVRERPRLRRRRPAAADRRRRGVVPERCRARPARWQRQPGRATLSTLTADGFPFGSVVSIVVNDDGEPVMCISALAEHTINARRDRRASVLIAEPVPEGADPLAAARLTLVGTLVQHAEVPADAPRPLPRAPPGRRRVHRLQRLLVVDARPVERALRRRVRAHELGDGRGVPGGVARSRSPRRPSGICTHMNDDHADANLLYAQRLAGLRRRNGGDDDRRRPPRLHAAV